MVVSGEPGSSIHIPVNPQGSARLPDDRDSFRSHGSLLMQAAGVVEGAAVRLETDRRQRCDGRIRDCTQAGRYARSARYVPAVQSARTCRARSSLV